MTYSIELFEVDAVGIVLMNQCQKSTTIKETDEELLRQIKIECE
jgi:hypothetical protein